MSRKYRINEKIIVKATGNVGIIKSKDTIKLDGKHVDIQYIVKEGNGINNWHAYNKTEIEPIAQTVNYPKYLYRIYDIDDRKLTLCAVVSKAYKIDRNDNFTNKAKSLDIGYSICHPSDKYNEELGKKIARKRTKTLPFCNLYSLFGGEFNNDFVYSIMDAKARFIHENINKFINNEE